MAELNGSISCMFPHPSWPRIRRNAEFGMRNEKTHETLQKLLQFGGLMKDFMAVARDAALNAGRILKDNINGIREISYKGDINLVTEMDMRSERAVVETLRTAFPDHGIIAEEETNIGNSSGFTWIIDPLDGTTNYAHGYPCFSDL